MDLFRPNVAAILRKPETGEIFIAERIDYPGSWQFPQGGVDKGEDLIAALYREVHEEIGIEHNLYDLVACRTDYRYRFPKNRLKNGKYCGQNQTFFLCDYHGNDEDFDFTVHVQEFVNFQWISPIQFDLDWVPRFKRKVFSRVLHDFFNITVPNKEVKPGKI